MVRIGNQSLLTLDIERRKDCDGIQKKLEYQFERLQARKELALSEFRIRKKQRAYRYALLQELGLKTAESAATEPEITGEEDADTGGPSDDAV